MAEPGIRAFFNYAVERESLRQRRRDGQPWPWTDDPVLREFRFCNVFREDDTTTIWFRDTIREPLRNERRPVVLATTAFRWFNRIETWELVEEWQSRQRGRTLPEFFRRWVKADVHGTRDDYLNELRAALQGNAPWTTGSYIIKTPDGMDKLEGVLRCIQLFDQRLDELTVQIEKHRTLQGAWEALRTVPYLGDFMAYEVVTDLRHTCLLEGAGDVNTWANPGPGACRGMARVNDLPLDRYDRGKTADREQVIAGMRMLLEVSRNDSFWPREWRGWELREVEHTLCEFDKYERARTGAGRPRQRFRRPA